MEKKKFFTYGWNLITDDRYKESPEHVVAWALDEDNNTCCLHFTSFKDTFVVGLPSYIGSANRIIDWKQSKLNLERTVTEVLGTLPPPLLHKEGKPIHFAPTQGADLFYYHAAPSVYYKFKLPSVAVRSKVRSKLCTAGILARIKTAKPTRQSQLVSRGNTPSQQVDTQSKANSTTEPAKIKSTVDASPEKVEYEYSNANLKMTVYDDDIDIRVKLITAAKKQFCEWVEVDCKPSSTNFCRGGRDYIVIDHAATKKADAPGMGKPIVLAFDIECNSAKLQFPNKMLINDYIGTIQLAYAPINTPESEYKVEVLTLFRSNPIPGINVIVCKTEKELLKTFMERIKIIGPNWICGYNIDGFDTPYIVKRCDMYGLKLDFSFVANKSFSPMPVYGSMNGRFTDGMLFNAPGILSKDLLKTGRSKLRLRTYKLDDVAKEMYGQDENDNKIDIGGYKQIFLAMQNYDETDPASVAHMTEIINYGARDAVLCLRLFNTFACHYDDCAMANASCVPIEILNSRGQMARANSQEYVEGKNRTPQIMRTPRGVNNEPFTGGDVSTPVPGFYEGAATLDFKSLYPNIIIKYNICRTTLINPDYYYAMDNNPKMKETWGEPLSEENPKGKWRKFLIPEGDKVYEYRFVSEHVYVGILPTNAKKLLKLRAETRAEGKKYEEGSVEWLLTDVKQNAIKITGNSGYGVLKAPGGYASIECARVVTGIGRGLKKKVEAIIERNGCQVIYGDTDSVMFKINAKTEAEQFAIGKRLQKEVSDEVGLEMELEKVGRILSLKPKHYIYWPWDPITKQFATEKNGLDAQYLIRGVVSTKRDRPPCHIRLYSDIYDMVMHRKSANEVLNFVWQSCIDIYFGAMAKVKLDENGIPQPVMEVETKIKLDADKKPILDADGKFVTESVYTKKGHPKLKEGGIIPERLYDINGAMLVATPCSWRDMEMTFKMGENYDNENYHLNVLAERLKDEGKPIEVGDRFGAMLKKTTAKGVGAKMITTDEYEEYVQEMNAFHQGKTDTEPELLKLDRLYYIERKMADTTDYLISVPFKDDITIANDKHNSAALGRMFQRLYLDYGSDLLWIISGKPDPLVAVYTEVGFERMADELRTMYTREIANRKSVNYNISASVVKNFVKHIMLRIKLMAEIEQDGRRRRTWHNSA